MYYVFYLCLEHQILETTYCLKTKTPNQRGYQFDLSRSQSRKRYATKHHNVVVSYLESCRSGTSARSRGYATHKCAVTWDHLAKCWQKRSGGVLRPNASKFCCGKKLLYVVATVIKPLFIKVYFFVLKSTLPLLPELITARCISYSVKNDCFPENVA